MDKDFFLIRKMKNGDEEAMDIFVRKYYEKILNYCYYHCADRQYAENLTQETFVKFFAGLPRYKHSGRSMNFLYTVARNLCMDFHRNEKERYAQSSEILEKEICCNQTDEQESRIDMRDALKEIPGDMREVIFLYYFYGFNTREISELLGIGLSLVKYRIKTGREKLRAILGEEVQE